MVSIPTVLRKIMVSNIIKSVTGFFDSYKWIITIISVLSALATIFTYVDSNGYNRAVSEYEAATAKALEKNTKDLIEKAQIDMQKALNLQAVIHKDELARAEKNKKTEIVYKEIIKNVDTLPVKPECTTISDDAFLLLNESINNSSTR